MRIRKNVFLSQTIFQLWTALKEKIMRTAFIVLIILFSGNSFTEAQRADIAINNYSTKYPLESVYIQLDNSLYAAALLKCAVSIFLELHPDVQCQKPTIRKYQTDKNDYKRSKN
jgi:hypothetical protein